MTHVPFVVTWQYWLPVSTVQNCEDGAGGKGAGGGGDGDGGGGEVSNWWAATERRERVGVPLAHTTQLPYVTE